MADAPSAYPLAWPPNRPRTPATQRVAGGFHGTELHSSGYRQTIDLTVDMARARLRAEYERLRARNPVLSSNLRSNNPQPRDPGAAFYFQLDGKPIVLACDRYTQVAQNIAAVAAHIDATRRIERYGVATMAQMFTGFLALPAPMVVDDWRAALGNPTTRAEAEAAWKERMRRAHPDVAGGSVADAARLNAAITRAREVLR